MEPANRPPIAVDLIADLSCPWCYLGLARLDRARAMLGDRPIQLRWWPFFLNPHLPAEGMDRQTYLRLKFGGDAAARQVYARIVNAGAADGIAFAFERIRRTPNTLLAHRLILLADEQGRADATIRALFRALFIDGRDIGRADELVELAAPLGFDRDATAAFLAGTGHRNAVLDAHRRAERLGVRGVPVFVIEGQHLIAGAQPPEVLAGLLDVAACDGAPAPPLAGAAG